jgi:membrane-associated phospholipid phosphatase
MRVRGLCALLSVVALATSSVASAEEAEGRDLQWNPDWEKFRPLEYVLTGIAGPIAIYEYYAVPAQSQPHWRGGVLFDDAVRDAIRLRSPAALKAARTYSDALDVSLVLLSVGADSFVVPLFRGHPDVAVQLSLMDAESFALSSIVAISLYDTVGRTRPSYADCQRDPSVDVQCNISPTASFPSGHMNEAFTAAGLSCAHHAHVPIYGSRLADAFACGRDVALASADGILRIMGDRHYATDVLAGGANGLACG